MTSDIILNTIAELNNVNDLHSIGDVLLNLLKISTDTANMTNMGCRVGIYNKHTDEYITYFDSNHAHDTLSDLNIFTIH